MVMLILTYSKQNVYHVRIASCVHLQTYTCHLGVAPDLMVKTVGSIVAGAGWERFMCG
jgi:alkylhydroperoxidase/carboxymuconolactone decarboxylase family protein YurZ